MPDENEIAADSSPAAPAEGADNLQGLGVDRNQPRPGSAAHRIQQMSARMKQLEGMLEKSLSVNERAMSAFQSQIQPAQAAQKGTFDEYSEEQLEGAYAEALNKDSESYNPTRAALYMRELRKRDRESVKRDLTGQYDAGRALVQQHENTYREAIADLGEDAMEFENPSSSLKMLAVKEWETLKQRLGNQKVEQNPEYQRVAVMTAYSKWKMQQANRSAGQLNSKTRAREAISSGMEAEVNDATSIKAHFARGDVRGGLLAKPMVQAMVQAVQANKGRSP